MNVDVFYCVCIEVVARDLITLMGLLFPPLGDPTPCPSFSVFVSQIRGQTEEEEEEEEEAYKGREILYNMMRL